MLRTKGSNHYFFLMILASSWLTVGCGSQIPDVVSIDPAYQVQVNRWLEISGQVGAPITITDLIVKTEALGPNVLGQCTPASRPDNGKTTGDVNATEFHNTVRISPTLGSMSADTMRNVIFHELGHCVLSAGHNDSRLSNGNAASLMNSRALTSFPDSAINPWAKYYMAMLLGRSDVATTLSNRPDQIATPMAE